MQYNYTEFVNRDGEEMIHCAYCGHECFVDKDGNYECGVCGRSGWIGECVYEGEMLYNIEDEDDAELKAFKNCGLV